MEGLSLRPAFLGQPLHRVKPIFWEHEGNRAVRSGPWKAVMKLKGEWELYHIEEDRTEQNNLIGVNKAVAGLLIRQWDDWAATSFVDPWTGPARNNWGEEPRNGKKTGPKKK
jgi:arylsulfatase